LGYGIETTQKKQQMAKVAAWVWIAVAIGLIVLYQGGYLSNLLGTGTPTTTSVVPSTGLTAITLNTKDALSPTDKDANVSYYLFTKDGKFYKSGSTSAGTATVNVNYGADYDLIAFSDSTYYPVKTAFNADGGMGAAQSINLALNPVSNITVSGVYDDVTGTTSNISAGLGAQTSFRILYKVTTASSATHSPVIVVDANQTSVQDVTLGSLTKVACPQRLTTSAGRKKICFQDSDIKSSEGVRTVKGSVLFSASTTPSSVDGLFVIVIDTQGYLDPNYVVKGSSGFHENTENLNTNAQIGATDSNQLSVGFAG
jgi:hypothetical protein